jgi:pSer/pThr/pTyr-binding forkhead associated (FHA) protein
MIQLRILSGKMAGDIHVVRHFPFHIGRAATNDLCLDDAGVWDRHLTVNLQKREGFLLQAAPDTFVAINDEPQNSACLRNGDVISFGSAKLQFWLAAPRQRSLTFRELCVWLLIAGVTGFQIAVIGWLAK